MCKSAYYVQHVMYHVVLRDSSAIKFELFILALFHDWNH